VRRAAAQQLRRSPEFQRLLSDIRAQAKP